MDYFCVLCDKTIEARSENKIQSITHNEVDKCIKTKHTNENPDFFDRE